MRFTIEQRHLTDVDGRPVTGPAAVTFHLCEAENVDDAVASFVGGGGAEIIGNVLKFPGFQAVLTIRRPSGVYTLQVTPASSQDLRVR